ncbi:MAG: META domain-containing protein [Paracoccus sp. (in: a-proteobacteria)]|uniref:META domain-containing protein n=1 Tax=Paracoccus sp. TaxID=267 RepID=UPI003918928B
MSRLRLLPAAVLGLFALSACDREAPGTGAMLAPGSSYLVHQIDGMAAPEGVTLEIPEAGRIAGQAPCNRYFAGFEQDAASLAIGAVGATRMACLDDGRMAAETAFLSALEAVTTAAPGAQAGQIALGDGTRTRLLLTPDA